MTKFKDPARQRSYLYAKANHDRLIKGQNGPAMAYNRGYNNGSTLWPREWSCYPYWAAGRDNRRKHERNAAHDQV